MKIEGQIRLKMVDEKKRYKGRERWLKIEWQRWLKMVDDGGGFKPACQDGS